MPTHERETAEQKPEKQSKNKKQKCAKLRQGGRRQQRNNAGQVLTGTLSSQTPLAARGVGGLGWGAALNLERNLESCRSAEGGATDSVL